MIYDPSSQGSVCPFGSRRGTLMENDANFADAVRQTFEPHTEALSAVMKALEQLPKQGVDAHRQTVEQWHALARMSKESVVAAINQGFDLWERESRRHVGAHHS